MGRSLRGLRSDPVLRFAQDASNDSTGEIGFAIRVLNRYAAPDLPAGPLPAKSLLSLSRAERPFARCRRFGEVLA